MDALENLWVAERGIELADVPDADAAALRALADRGHARIEQSLSGRGEIVMITDAGRRALGPSAPLRSDESPASLLWFHIRGERP